MDTINYALPLRAPSNEIINPLSTKITLPRKRGWLKILVGLRLTISSSMNGLYNQITNFMSTKIDHLSAKKKGWLKVSIGIHVIKRCVFVPMKPQNRLVLLEIVKQFYGLGKIREIAK